MIKNRWDSTKLFQALHKTPVYGQAISVTAKVNASDAVVRLPEKLIALTEEQPGRKAGKVYDNNTNGIEVKVKDNAGNTGTCDIINVTQIDKKQAVYYRSW